jgi:hypothetical protein
MSVGTSAGLLDEQRAQSIFKHKVLGSYLRPFALRRTHHHIIGRSRLSGGLSD